MNIFESFQSAFQSVRANKLRSFLTMLGIIIGISSVITIVSIGDGAKNFISGEFADIGTNLINLKVNSSIEDTVEERDFFTMEDVKLIKDKIPEVTHVMPELQGFGVLKTEKKLKPVRVGLSNPDSQKIYNIKMIKGRYLTDHDIDAAKNVAVLDEPTAKKLFNSVDIVGEKVKFNAGDRYIDLSIIGVCKDPNGNLSSAFGDNMPGLILTPITIADRIFKYTDISGLSVILSDMTNADEISNKMIRLMENVHKNKDKYSAQKGFKELETIDKVLSTLTAVLGAIAAISLLVGGIGVMNIMLVSVTERTREIGIRKAIGAKTRDIKIQFLMESIILCLIGGTIGTILGISVGKIASSLIHVNVPVSIKVILVSFGFSSAVGIFFGLYPANKAAKLDPIEALRYE
ncbi:ABC transporter permease [Clostridium lundense]|uniref:ABC transporter permease n=1 Tax=Clostridium lundense TaxID=319475 RepID=UPI00048115E8|nr:ABC transporter permease [Clostridium lundense]